MKRIEWKVVGMTCTNCALSINNTLLKQGSTNVSVNAITGEVSFDITSAEAAATARQKVEGLGYEVAERPEHAASETLHHSTRSPYLLRFWICLPFSAILMLHMIKGLHLHWLMLPWLQFGLALPVFIIGMEFFGKSAWHSLRSGVPNMNVLIALGSLAAFGYSTYGLFTDKPEQFLFFETASSIITIVFFGYWLEDISVARTQREIKKLTRTQRVMANMIAFDDNQQEQIFPVESSQLRIGDLVLIKTGEQVPADCKMLSGEAELSEAIITGESTPVAKKKGDLLIGGSVMVNGYAKAYVQAVGEGTIMQGIVQMVKKAQTEKPPVQQLADRISAVFIPLVVIIAVATLLINFFAGDQSFRESLMRSVAVLVIACPCAMGLATPAAIAVGLGRAAKNGILYTDVSRMELFRKIRCMVFDKTGTLTTGNFQLLRYQAIGESDEFIRKLVFSIEKYSTHPVAKCIAASWPERNSMRLHQVQEIKGSGLMASDDKGHNYTVGSTRLFGYTPTEAHSMYVSKNGILIGWIDMADELRPEAKEVIDFCKSRGIETCLLSGDTQEKCREVANRLGIEKVYAEKTPAEKLQIIEELNASAPTAMVGDGINDAPALAKASISISLSEASQLAIQNAGVVLTRQGLGHLPKAFLLGKHTYGTIRSNLFWAFFYNIIAIPVAAVGLLHPSLGALIMGGSDVVLALNSLYLGIRKLK
jgi:Cu+-exporting ATPase